MVAYGVVVDIMDECDEIVGIGYGFALELLLKQIPSSSLLFVKCLGIGIEAMRKLARYQLC